MNALNNRYFFPSIHPARPYLLVKGVLLLLAFDTWLDMVEHGGRYGVGSFNVAHFGWLDAIQNGITDTFGARVPSAELYVGLILCTGLLAFIVVVGRSHRVFLAIITVAYTYAWSMSMLDSYQHHYLLSWVFLCLTLFPLPTGTDVFGPPARSASEVYAVDKSPATLLSAGTAVVSLFACLFALTALEIWDPLVRVVGVLGMAVITHQALLKPRPLPKDGSSNWAYTLLSLSIATVYLYTGISKTEANWISGAALQQIAEAPLAPIAVFADSQLGIEADQFWPLLGMGAITVQFVIAIGYALAPLRDRHPAMGVIGWISFIAAMSFHLGAEYLKLQIGWFSWYMVLTAAICFLPGRALEGFGLLVTWPGRVLAAVFSVFDQREDETREKQKSAKAKSKTTGHGPYRSGEAPKAKEERSPIMVPLSIFALLILGIAGYQTDLPGSVAGTVACGLTLLVAVGGLAYRRSERRARSWVVAASLGALVLWGSLAGSRLRFDFYRKLGGVHRRQLNYQLALDAYVKANRYAPEGEDRKEREEEMRRQVRAFPGGRQ
ncbi:MAG: HTTM domain-containing protein [Myxococcota bacterium]